MKRAASIWISGVLLVAFVFTGALADETRVVPLQHRMAADVIPLISPLLGPDDVITGMDSRLVIRTSDARYREVQKLLQQVDVARRQYRVSVRQTAATAGTRAQAGVSGEVGNDHMRVHIPRAPQAGGGIVVQRNGVRIDAQQKTTRASNDVTQFINVIDGGRAFVQVGQSVPHVQRLLDLSGAIVGQSVAYQDVATGFDVEPRAMGEEVELRITPQLSRLHDVSTGLADFQRFATTVVVRRGEWVDLGGLSGNGSDARRTILDSAAGADREQRTVLIKVE
jgi:hypothetical protein